MNREHILCMCLLGVWSAVHGYVETASVITVLNHVDQTSDDIVGLPLYRTQLKVSFGDTLHLLYHFIKKERRAILRSSVVGVLISLS